MARSSYIYVHTTLDDGASKSSAVLDCKYVSNVLSTPLDRKDIQTIDCSINKTLLLCPQVGTKSTFHGLRWNLSQIPRSMAMRLPHDELPVQDEIVFNNAMCSDMDSLYQRPEGRDATVVPVDDALASESPNDSSHNKKTDSHPLSIGRYHESTPTVAPFHQLQAFLRAVNDKAELILNLWPHVTTEADLCPPFGCRWSAECCQCPHIYDVADRIHNHLIPG